MWTLPYSAFGTAQPNSSGLIYNLRFAGQYYDGETGLNQNYYRDYDPTTGRYIESDPIGLAGGTNPYAYVTGDPLSYTDVSGNDPFVGATVGAITGGIYGGIGAYLAGGNATDIAVAVGTGALIGGGIGALDPTLGIATLAVIGGASAGLGDVAGQAIAQSLEGQPVDINFGSTAGAVLGGALAGAGGSALFQLLEEQLALSEAGATAATASITAGPGSILPSIGAKIQDFFTKSQHCQ